MRINGFCDHITSPVAPTILFGVSPIEAVRMSEKWAADQSVEYFHKPSNTRRTRNIRSDRACAVVGVMSVPPSWVDDSRWNDFTDASIHWLRSLYRERLKSVVAHLDEHCLHIHYWLIPNNDESIGRVHPGEAELQRVGFGAPRIVRDTAYKKAMTSMLDDFELRVTSKFGLLRRTVNKRRLSRQEWIKQKWLAAEKKYLIETNDSLIENSAMHPQDKDKEFSSADELSYSDAVFSKPIVTVAPKAEMTVFNTEGLGIFGQWVIALRHDEEVRQVDRPVF